jgi:aryl-alcohol dehydrogenase-like predicted oxidoreductase
MTKTLILGTVQFGLDYGITNRDGQPSPDHIFEILDQAWHSGVRFLDTADSYGSAIDIIASYHRLRSHRFQVITKTLRNPAHASADISLAWIS